VSGGKEWRPSTAWQLFQAGEALLEEALSPLTDDLTWGIEAQGDLVVTEAGGSVEDDLGTDDISIW